MLALSAGDIADAPPMSATDTLISVQPRRAPRLMKAAIDEGFFEKMRYWLFAIRFRCHYAAMPLLADEFSPAAAALPRHDTPMAGAPPLLLHFADVRLSPMPCCRMLIFSQLPR